MEKHYQALVRLTDKLVPTVLSLQEKNPQSPEYGAFIAPGKGFAEPSTCGNCIDLLLAAFYAPESAYYRDEKMLEAARLYLEALLRLQNEDGTLDLRETNFHDATCTAFTVQVLGYTWKMLCRCSAGSPAENAIKGQLYRFFERSAHGMCTGGFHTPNHRWVLSSALSLCSNILKDDQCRRQVSLYLAEGIDCDENGEFTERSTGIYNTVNDRSLIIIARELGMPELLGHVKRNLQMMYAYIEPDFSVFTLNSRRQDNGKAVYPTNYYDCYLYMALLTGDAGFAWMADRLLHLLEAQAANVSSLFAVYHQSIGFVNHLSHYLGDEHLRAFEPVMEKPCLEGSWFFERSKIVRIRSGDISLSLVGDNPTFCVFQKGAARVRIRMAASFYAKGVFASPEIEPLGDGGYRLAYSYRWGYTRPFPNGSPTSIWEEMDHASREHVNMMSMQMQVLAHWLPEGGVRLEISVKGVERLPSRIELAFDAGGTLQTPDVILDGTAGSCPLLTGSEASYFCQGETFSIQCPYSGQQHTYTYNMRGGLPKAEDAFTLYLAAMGEACRELIIR